MSEYEDFVRRAQAVPPDEAIVLALLALAAAVQDLRYGLVECGLTVRVEKE